MVGPMNQSMMFAVAALGCSIYLAVSLSARLWPVVAAVIAGAEVMMAMGLFRLSISGVSLVLVLGVGLSVAGGVCWMKVTGKTQVTAATVILLVGVLQVLTGAMPR